jgi:hypothetical protein
MNLCPICREIFANWVDYHAHLSLSHGVTHKQKEQEIEIGVSDILTLLVKPKELKQREYKRMDPIEKFRIVRAWEAKQKEGAIIG